MTCFCYRWLLVLDVLVDGLGGSLAGAHGLDDGSSTGDGVTAGVHALAAGLALVALGDDAAVLVGLEARRGGADEGVGAGTQAHDDGVHVHRELAALLLDGAAAAGSIRFAQLHLDAGDGLDEAVLIGQDLHGVAEGLEDNALFLGVLDLFLTGRQLSHAAAVDDIDRLSAQTQGAAGSVHCHIAAADDGDLPAGADGGLAGGQISLHQIGAGEELVGGVDALQALARDAHEAGQAGTGTHEDGLVAVLTHQLVDGEHLADDPIALKSDFILSLCELVVGGKDGLMPVEKTIIDRCVRMVYRDYLSDPVPENMPILEDLYNELRRQEEKEAQYIATALEIYVSGSLNVFNHRTNINIENRIVSFDIKELGKQLKKIGMLIVQDAVWNRVTINREAHKSTRYYIDEMHLLLREEQTAAYTVEIWKRFRKWGGIPTGITQNVKDLLSSREVENIFGATR